jgi:hypothetical protein
MTKVKEKAYRRSDTLEYSNNLRMGVRIPLFTSHNCRSVRLPSVLLFRFAKGCPNIKGFPQTKSLVSAAGHGPARALGYCLCLLAYLRRRFRRRKEGKEL